MTSNVEDKIIDASDDTTTTTSAAEIYKLQGNEKYSQQEYHIAADLYSKAIELEPTNAAYYGNRAAANFMIGNYEKVVEDCTRAIVMEPKFIKAYLRKGKAQTEMGCLEAAIDTYTAGLVREPNDSTLYNEKSKIQLALERLKRGHIYLQTQKYYEAESCFTSVLEISPRCYQAKLGKAEALIEKEQYDEAFGILTQLLRADHTNAHNNISPAEIMYFRGRCLYYQGDFTNAIKHLQQAAKSDPDNNKYVTEIKKIRMIESEKEVANNYYKQRDYQQAIEGYTRCLQIDPKNKPFLAKLHCNRAAAFSQLNKHAEAITDSDKCLYYDSTFVKAYLRKADSLHAIGDVASLEQCIREYEKACEFLNSSQQRDIQQKIRQAKLDLKKAKTKDYYKILELPNKSATDSEIKKAYRKLALKWHPDRHSSKTEEEQKEAEHKFKDIGEAYAVLSDPKKKQRYDAGADIEDLDNEFAGGMHGVDPSQVFQMFFGGGMGGMGMGGMGGFSRGNTSFHFG